VVAGARLPRRRFTGDGRSWPSGLHPGGGQALEVEHDVVNSSRRSRRRIRARVGAPHGEGGSGSRRQGGRARAEGERKGEGARRDPYHPRVLRRQLAVEDWWRRGEIVAAQWFGRRRRCPRLSGGTAAQGHGGSWGRQWWLRGSARERPWLRKGGGLGVRVVRATAPAPPADSLRFDLIQARAASGRKRRLGCWPVGPCEHGEGSPGVRQSGPRSVAGRPAGWGRNRGGEREGKRMLT
jgi:hypothetical protein